MTYFNTWSAFSKLELLILGIFHEETAKPHVNTHEDIHRT
jgi:hypothetical protein